VRFEAGFWLGLGGGIVVVGFAFAVVDGLAWGGLVGSLARL
jgi:hypothetical protein